MSVKYCAGSFIYIDTCVYAAYDYLLFFLSPLSEKMWTLWQVSYCTRVRHTAFNSLTWRFGNTATAECSRGSSSCWWCCDSAHQRALQLLCNAKQVSPHLLDIYFWLHHLTFKSMSKCIWHWQQCFLNITWQVLFTNAPDIVSTIVLAKNYQYYLKKKSF